LLFKPNSNATHSILKSFTVFSLSTCNCEKSKLLPFASSITTCDGNITSILLSSLVSFAGAVIVTELALLIGQFILATFSILSKSTSYGFS
jgi:hypothetical protein